MNGQFTLQQAEQLLNFEAKLDVNLLDAVVHCFYDSLGEEVGVHRCRVAVTAVLWFSYVSWPRPAVGSYPELGACRLSHLSIRRLLLRAWR